MRIWERFPEIARAVRENHERVGLHGHHDFVHAFRVGEVAYRIGLDEYDERTAELAGVAGMCHNADRVLQRELGIRRCAIDPDSLRPLVIDWLRGMLSDDATSLVYIAVLGHDLKNSASDSEVGISLKDADRVVNLDVDLLIRSGQYYHDLPAVDYRHLIDDPKATYHNPKSVLRDIAYALDWADPRSDVCVRTRLGKKMAEDRVKILRTFFEALVEQLTEEGIHPSTFAQ